MVRKNNIDNKTNEVYQQFYQMAKSVFDFLTTSYDFKEKGFTKSIYGCFLEYLNKTTRVVISYQPREGGIYVEIGKSKVREPILPIYFHINKFYLNYLIYLRTSKDIKQDFHELNKPNFDYMNQILINFADALIKYSEEVLKGDFKVLSKIENAMKNKI